MSKYAENTEKFEREFVEACLEKKDDIIRKFLLNPSIIKNFDFDTRVKALSYTAQKGSLDILIMMLNAPELIKDISFEFKNHIINLSLDKNENKYKVILMLASKNFIKFEGENLGYKRSYDAILELEFLDQAMPEEVTITKLNELFIQALQQKKIFVIYQCLYKYSSYINFENVKNECLSSISENPNPLIISMLFDNKKFINSLDSLTKEKILEKAANTNNITILYIIINNTEFLQGLSATTKKSVLKTLLNNSSIEVLSLLKENEEFMRNTHTSNDNNIEEVSLATLGNIKPRELKAGRVVTVLGKG